MQGFQTSILAFIVILVKCLAFRSINGYSTKLFTERHGRQSISRYSTWMSASSPDGKHDSHGGPLPRDPSLRNDSFATLGVKRGNDILGEVNSGRRVLKLINSIQESADRKDFASPMWETIRYEATAIAEGDMKAATIMANAVLSQPSLQECITDYISNALDSSALQATQIRNIIQVVCESHPHIPADWAIDVMASAMRDSSQPNAVSVLLFNQGFHSLAIYRIANALWYSGRDGLARYFQSIASRNFGADIHPACTIGPGCYLASGTSIVIGETAVIGSDCCLAHGVTLGGTGKESGDRHPKLGNGVYIAAGATVLGNIAIGEGSIINAGSVVTKSVAPFTRVGGVPAKLISQLSFNDILLEDLAQASYNEKRGGGGVGEGDESFPSKILEYHPNGL